MWVDDNSLRGRAAQPRLALGSDRPGLEADHGLGPGRLLHYLGDLPVQLVQLGVARHQTREGGGEAGQQAGAGRAYLTLQHSQPKLGYKEVKSLFLLM